MTNNKQAFIAEINTLVLAVHPLITYLLADGPWCSLFSGKIRMNPDECCHPSTVALLLQRRARICSFILAQARWHLCSRTTFHMMQLEDWSKQDPMDTYNNKEKLGNNYKPLLTISSLKPLLMCTSEQSRWDNNIWCMFVHEFDD